MSGQGHAQDPEAVRLRDAIASDLLALRRGFSRGAASLSGGDLREQMGRMLRANPTWAAAAAAGALAGLWVAVRNRLRKP